VYTAHQPKGLVLGINWLQRNGKAYQSERCDAREKGRTRMNQMFDGGFPLEVGRPISGPSEIH